MKNFILVLSVLLLTGCSGGNKNAGISIGAETPLTWYAQDFGDFTIQIPPGWARGDVIQGIMANYKSSAENNFVKNMNIVKTTTDEQKTSKEYAQENIESIKEAFAEYKEVAIGEVDVNGARTLLHKFQARNNTNDNFAYFTQGYFAKGDTGYIVTCVVSEYLSEMDRKTCSQVVESFRFK